MNKDKVTEIEEPCTATPRNQSALIEPLGAKSCPASAAIKYVLEHETEDPIIFLRCWYEGNFKSIREEWPDVPEEVFVGADPAYSLFCGEETDGICCTVTVDCDGTHIDDECKLRDCKNAQYHCEIRSLKPVSP